MSSQRQINFEKIEKVDDDVKILVFGFIRQQMVLLDLDHITIPDLIIFIIMHYFFNPECFTILSPHLSLDKDTNTLKNNEVGVHTAYGSIDIDGKSERLYQWTFKILMNESSCIGIDASGKKYTDKDWTIVTTNDAPFYAVGSFATYDHAEVISAAQKTGEATSGWWEPGDQIKMELCTKQKRLSFYQNGKLTFFWDDVTFEEDTCYNMAVLLYCEHESIQLTGFQVI